MGIILNAETNQTGATIVGWKLAILDSCNSIEMYRLQLSNQLLSMQDNQDYTLEDIVEVQALIDEIENRINDL